MAAMPLRNKIDPFGTITDEPMRGLFMGNRGGKMHDPASKTLLPRKTHVSRQWITCLIAFKNRQRTVMGNSYTELFFLDEVVSLAAGHRPCAECRRQDFKLYCAALSDQTIKAPDLDKLLHSERLAKRVTLAELAVGHLPDGIMLARGAKAYAKRGKLALPFSFAGYGSALPWADIAAPDALMLTPATSLIALQKGYAPKWHPSAGA